MAELKVYDMVRLGRSTIIVTGFNPTKPKNKYRGILATGQGKEYIFGDPVTVVGHVDENHPAVQRWQRRRDNRSMTTVSVEQRIAIEGLVDAVLAQQWTTAEGLARALDASFNKGGK